MKPTRREFLTASAALAATHAGKAVRMRSAPPLTNAQGREPLRELGYHEVRLTGGPFKDHYERIHAHYLALSNDSLLKVYRQRAGLPAPGKDMGGWYDLDGFVPGHTLGQYISGLARIGAGTGDPACRDKVRELVTGFAETLGPKNQSILRPETNLWICYTLDKHFAGLIDAATLAQMPEARDLLSRVLAGAEPLLPAQGRDRIGKSKPPYDETFVMPENLFVAGELTGNPRFGQLAERYLLDRDLFDPLARGEDPFPGQHAYSHAIALSSAARAYLILGEPKYRAAMDHAFTLLTRDQQFASGGWGPNETFIRPHRGELYTSLSTTVDHFETPCGSYAATKLARYLLRTGVPANSAYGDNLERVLFNTILAARDPDSDGDYFYYTTYSRSATKTYYPKKWPCCSGTLVQTVADYPLNVFFVQEASAVPALYVNLYTPAEAEIILGQRAVRIQQETRYPASDQVLLRVNPAAPQRFALVLRIPAWLTRPATIHVNGNVFRGATSAGSMVRLEKLWHPGDTVTLTLPLDFRTEAIDDLHPGTVALMRGPVQYVALDPAPARDNDRTRLPADPQPVPGQAETFLHDVGGQQILLVPLYKVRNETYTSYFERA